MHSKNLVAAGGWLSIGLPRKQISVNLSVDEEKYVTEVLVHTHKLIKASSEDTLSVNRVIKLGANM